MEKHKMQQNEIVFGTGLGHFDFVEVRYDLQEILHKHQELPKKSELFN